jgi:hypothetical protein
MYSDPTWYLSEVDMVFTGKVVALVKMESKEIEIPEFLDTIPKGKEQWKSMNPDLYYAKVVMIENLKGNTVRTDTLFFTSSFTNCDPYYELNESYLFFANPTKDNQYIMEWCTPWGKIEDCEQTISKLKDLKSILTTPRQH